MTLAINVGARMPAHATSMGKVLLASLPDAELEAYLARAALQRYPAAHGDRPRTSCASSSSSVRAAGYAIVDQELEEGLVAIAAPVRARGGARRSARSTSPRTSRAASADRSATSCVEPLLRTRASDRGRPRRRRLAVSSAPRSGRRTCRRGRRSRRSATSRRRPARSSAARASSTPERAQPRAATSRLRTPTPKSNGPRWPHSPRMSGEAGMCSTGSMPAAERVRQQRHLLPRRRARREPRVHRLEEAVGVEEHPGEAELPVERARALERRDAERDVVDALRPGLLRPAGCSRSSHSISSIFVPSGSAT